MYLPIGLFGVSIATAVLPAVSRHAAADDDGRTCRRHGRAQAGDDADAERAGDVRPHRAGDADRAAALRARPFHSPPTPRPRPPRRCGSMRSASSATRPCASSSPTFYALRRSRVPVMVSMCTVALNIALNVTLVHLMGFLGLALSTSIAALANGGALVLPAAPAPARHRGPAPGRDVRQDRHRRAGDGGDRAGRRQRTADRAVPALASRCRWCGWPRRSGRASWCSGWPPGCCASMSSTARWPRCAGGWPRADRPAAAGGPDGCGTICRRIQCPAIPRATRRRFPSAPVRCRRR